MVRFAFGVQRCFSLISVKDFNDLKKKLEKERDLKFEEATKEVNTVKLEVESRRGLLEARQKDVEAAVAEVFYMQIMMGDHFCIFQIVYYLKYIIDILLFKYLILALHLVGGFYYCKYCLIKEISSC